MIKIRMSRGGRKSLPVYTIVAIDSKNARNGKFLQKLGQYNPKVASPLIDINVADITKWISNGAQLSDTVNSLLKKHNIKI